MKNQEKQANAKNRRDELIGRLATGKIVPPHKDVMINQTDIRVARDFYKNLGKDILTITKGHKVLGYCLLDVVVDKLGVA